MSNRVLSEKLWEMLSQVLSQDEIKLYKENDPGKHFLVRHVQKITSRNPTKENKSILSRLVVEMNQSVVEIL